MTVAASTTLIVTSVTVLPSTRSLRTSSIRKDFSPLDGSSDSL